MGHDRSNRIGNTAHRWRIRLRGDSAGGETDVIWFDHTLHLPDPDGGEHLATLQCAVNLWDGEVEATEDGRAVELDEYQLDKARTEAIHLYE